MSRVAGRTIALVVHITIVHQIPAAYILRLVLIEIRESETMGVLMTDGAKRARVNSSGLLLHSTIDIDDIGLTILLKRTGIAVIFGISRRQVKMLTESPLMGPDGIFTTTVIHT